MLSLFSNLSFHLSESSTASDISKRIELQLTKAMNKSKGSVSPMLLIAWLIS